MAESTCRDLASTVLGASPTTDLSAALLLFKGPRTPPLPPTLPVGRKISTTTAYASPKNGYRRFPYIFMNPYRANLLAADEKWPWDHCAPEDRHGFGGVTNESVPIPAWLR